MTNLIFEAFSGIDARFIEEAAEFSPKSRKRPARTAILSGAAAAALAVAIVPTAIILSKPSTTPDTPPFADTPADPPTSPDNPTDPVDPVDPNEPTDPVDPPIEPDDPENPTDPVDPQPPGGGEEPPMMGSPMSLGEVRTLPSGTEIAYSAQTDHSLTILLKKADSIPVYLRLAGSNGSEVYYASTDPRYSDEGTRVDAFTITVDGERGDFPSAPGEYTIVIDYTPLKEKCRSLGELYTSLGAFFL